MVERHSVRMELNFVDRVTMEVVLLELQVELQVNVVVVLEVHRVQQVTVPKVDLLVDQLYEE